MTTRAAARPATDLRLRPPRHRVERRAIALWTLRALIGTALTPLPPAAAAVTLALFDVVPWLVLILWAVTAAAGASGLAVTAVMPTWRYRVHRWEVTDEAVYTASGWLWQEWRIAPLSRIQTVDPDRRPLQPAFGLASLPGATASAPEPLKVDGRDPQRASDL